MRILLFGCRGQLGSELCRVLAPLGDLIPLDRRGQDGLVGDLTDLEGIGRAVRVVAPAVVVNAAAYTAVDRAESEQALAYRINGAAPGALAAACNAHNALLVHYSTDYVFDGIGEAPWRETDEPRPLNVYGASKLAGERAVQASGGSHLIFRSSWVYGPSGENFIRKMLALARERTELRVVADQVGAPTAADLIADVSAVAISRKAAGAPLAGVYHIAAAGETSWHGYAQRVIDWARSAGWPVQARSVEAVSSREFATAAQRPLNSRLDTQRLRAALGIDFPDWTHGVERMVRHICRHEAR